MPRELLINPPHLKLMCMYVQACVYACVHVYVRHVCVRMCMCVHVHVSCLPCTHYLQRPHHEGEAHEVLEGLTSALLPWLMPSMAW